MNFIHFQLVTPEAAVLSKELVSLTCMTQMGEITILPNHVPLVANLVPGELHAKTEHDDFYLYVAGGFVEVRKNNEIVVLADDAEHHYDIDLQKALEAQQRAEKTLKEKQLSGQEYARVAASLNQSLARINVARRHASRRGPMTGGGVMHE
jgi:F-type H+-transporting ATPase subunit epsilon